MLRNLFFIAFLCFSGISYAQWNSSRCNTFSVVDTIKLDSFTVIQESIEITPKVKYRFFADLNAIVVESNQKEIEVCYQVLPYELHSEKYNRLTSELDSTGVIFRNIYTEQKEEFFSTPGIEKSGVVSRGISFGNNQDVFVNSNLNLQLQGDISKDVKLTATISDQNIPLQPDGNTQQIQEFDRIYMELEHTRWKLQAGDIWMKNNDENFFMKYNKRVQGGAFNVNIIEDSNYYSNTYVAASLARGKFFSQIIQPIEGIQGPYRLNGANGENFIIIIANSEKVFLDGKELQRGFNYDYVIDYNTGEITFNNTITITKFSRVRVDFEYTERNFTRSVIKTGHEQKIGDVDVRYEFFTERDHPNQPILTDLSENDFLKLNTVGDSLNLAFQNGARLTDTASQVMYKQIISGFDTIYEYTKNVDSAKYVVVFSEVGQGAGDYVIDESTINGRIFKYVGKGFGNYLPVRFLPVPNKREMMVLGTKWNRTKNTSFYNEISLSNNDPNIVSNIGNRDNRGVGVLIGQQTKDKKIGVSRYTYSTKVEYQYTSQSFRPLDRIREADFQRDWNENRDLFAEDNMVNSSIGFKDRNGNFLSVDNNFRNKRNDVNGFQNHLKWNKSIGNFNVNGFTFLMDNNKENTKAQWRRFTIDPNYTIKNITQGYRLNVDKNRVLSDSDSVLSTQMNFEEHNFYLKNGDTAQTQFLLNYQTRKDFKAKNGILNWFEGLNTNLWDDKAQTYTANLNRSFSPSQQMNFTGTYRELETKLLSIQNEDSSAFEKNLLSRLDWNSNYFKRHISSDITYTVNTSRELKREFQYVKWDNFATATHVWRDNNNDGVQDLDEFFSILNQETQNTFVKFIVPTNEYINAFTNNLNMRVNLKGPSGWRNKEGFKSFLARFDNLSILNTERKSTENNLNSRLNPFLGLLDTINLTDINVLSVQKSIRSTLFFNRTNSKYGFDLTRSNLATKQLITNGTDSRLQDGWDFNSRVNISRYVSTNTSLDWRKSYSISTYLDTRNYDIDNKSIEEILAIQPLTSLRLSTTYKYSLKIGESTLESTKAEINNVGAEIKVNQLSKRTIQLNFNYINISYNGEANNPLGYEIMEGLQVGDNFTWQVNLQQRLSNGLNINLIYEGRKSEQNNAIHTGRMQVSALF